MTYQELIERIAEHMLVDRPAIPLGFSLTPVASVVAAAVAAEDPGFISAADGVARVGPAAA